MGERLKKPVWKLEEEKEVNYDEKQMEAKGNEGVISFENE